MKRKPSYPANPVISCHSLKLIFNTHGKYLEGKTLEATLTVMKNRKKVPRSRIKETTGMKTKPRNEDFISNFC